MAISKHKPASNALLDRLVEKKTKANTSFGNFKVSFEYFDPAPMYASSFADWQQVGLLSHALDHLKGFCCSPLLKQVDGKKFAIYGDFPNPDSTKFDRPAHVPLDANWARIHINGPAVLVGHVHEDTFYLVYLDKTHKFWLTKRVKGN